MDKVVEKISRLVTKVCSSPLPRGDRAVYLLLHLQRPIELADQQLLLLDQAVTVPSEATHAIGDAALKRELWCPSASMSGTAAP